jgi:hypothetical protein
LIRFIRKASGDSACSTSHPAPGRFRQFALVASNGQHDRGDPLAKLRMRSQSAISASSLNSPTAIRRHPPNQSNPNLLCIALNRTRREAADCLFAESGVGHSKVAAVGESSSGMRPGVFAIVGPRGAIDSAGAFAFLLR